MSARVRCVIFKEAVLPQGRMDLREKEINSYELGGYRI